MNYSKAFIDLRKSKKLTQSKFAEYANVTPGYISKIEKGERIPTLEVIEKICVATNTPFPVFALLAYNSDDSNGEVKQSIRVIQESMLGILSYAENPAHG